MTPNIIHAHTVQAATVTVLDSYGNDVAFAVASSVKGEQALRPR